MTDMTRRHFMRNTAAATAAVSTFNILSSHAQEAAGRETLKVALVGCGGRGHGALRQFREAAQLLGKDVEVVAVCDAFEDRVKGALQGVDASRGHWGFDAYKKAAESDAEFVLMATPPNFRPVHLETMIEAGKHCFIEKPVAVDPVGVRKVIEVGERAKAKGLAIVAGTQRRYQKNFIMNKARVDAGAVGQIVGGTVSWNGNIPWIHRRKDHYSDAEYLVRNWLNFTELSGDHICEQHVHNLDIANWFIGRPPQTFIGFGGRARRETGNQFDFFSVDMDYGDGVHIHSQCRQITGCYNRVGEVLRGTEGQVDGGGRIIGKEVAVEDVKLEHGSGYVQEHVELIKGARNGKPVNDARSVAEATLCAVGGRISAYTGKLVRWRDMMENVNSELYSLELAPSALAFEQGEVALPPEVAPVPGA
jgi:myo-inositol 2-dehydrogenase/D-chiro-inositol 1-dehydrogenase